jgi:hypothetical protein
MCTTPAQSGPRFTLAVALAVAHIRTLKNSQEEPINLLITSSTREDSRTLYDLLMLMSEGLTFRSKMLPVLKEFFFG